MWEVFWKVKTTSLVTLLFLSIVYFLENFDRYLIGVCLIPYIDYSSYEYSILAGPAFTLVYSLGGLFISLNCTDGLHIFGSKVSKFNILAAATLLFSISFTLTAFAFNFWQQVIIRMIMGLSQSIITPFSTSIISDHFAPYLRGSAFGIFNSGTYFAFSFSLSIGVYLCVNYGWKSGYIIFGLIGIGFSLILPFLNLFNNDNNATIFNFGKNINYSIIHHNDESEKCKDFEKNEIIGDSNNVKLRNTENSYNNEMHKNSILLSNTSTILTNPLSNDEIDVSVEVSDETANLKKTKMLIFIEYFYALYIDLKEIFWNKWGNEPGVYLMCFATGIRLGI
jgi:hypothetical protein